MTSTHNIHPAEREAIRTLTLRNRRQRAERRAAERPDDPGRRALDRMAATPAEIDRLVRRLRQEGEER